MRRLVAIAAALLSAWQAWGATIAATKAGNWSDTTVWDLGRVPAAGDDVALASYAIVWDAGAGTRIPATSGTLTSITASGAGQITVAMNTIGTCSLYATTITCGTAAGIISTSGNGASATLTITGNITAGSASGAYGVTTGSATNFTLAIVGNTTGGSAANCQALRIGNTCTVTQSGNVTGGSNGTANGVMVAGSGTFALTGNATGGSAAEGVITSGSGNVTITNGTIYGSASANGISGVNHGSSTSTITLTNCNLENSTYAVAWRGRPPTWSNSSNANTITWVNTGRSNKWVTQPAASDVKAGVVVGDLTGTMPAPYRRGFARGVGR